MVGIAIIVAGFALVCAIFILVRFGNLPPWTHRDLLAFVALCSTVCGAVVLTALKWVQTDKFNEQSDRLISELVRERPSLVNAKVGDALSTIIDALTWNLRLDSAGIIVVLLSLGLVISARTIRAKVLGSDIELSGGDAAQGARAVADAADTTATGIEQQAGVADPPPSADVDAAPTARP